MHSCPKCQKDLPPAFAGTECPSCGVIFSKYFAAEAKRRATQAAASTATAAPAPVQKANPQPAPSRTASCPSCGDLVAIGAKTCPHCGQSNPAPAPKKKAGTLAYVLAGLLLVIFIVSAANRPTEGSGGGSTAITADQRTAAQVSIKLAGYRCDSISYMGRLVFKVGFRVTCNQDRYAYEIVDEGGRWVVKLD